MKSTRALVWALAAALLLVGRASAEDAPKPQTFDSQGVAIQYTVEGKGPPVVLVHGLYSSADTNWRMPGTIKLLAESYKVIAMDVRGHGGSGKPEKAEAYGVQMAEDVVRLLDHLKIEKAHVVGYSMGGMIAMKVAAKHPDRLLSVTLGGMGWLREGSMLAGFWSAMGERQGGAGGGPALAARSLGDLAVTEDEVKAIRLPVTILVGDRDPCRKLYVAPLEQVRKDWPVTVIDAAGHLNCIMKPQFKEELKKWLDKQG